MPKYWGKQIFTHGNFPEVGQKQKTEKKKKREKERRRRANDGNNNGHWPAIYCKRHLGCCMQATLAKNSR